MAEWVDVAPAGEFPPGTSRSIDLDGTAVAVFNVDGAYYALEDVCTHDGGQLTGGFIENDVIVCPRHFARFSIKTGEVLAAPAYEDVPTFEVRVASGVVQVRDARGG
jgi:3-phenylpropionate/trans-cinnamate dioxygenase ferredoxin subunit